VSPEEIVEAIWACWEKHLGDWDLEGSVANAQALGVKISEEDRHTALGDAKFARAIYDAVMGR